MTRSCQARRTSLAPLAFLVALALATGGCAQTRWPPAPPLEPASTRAAPVRTGSINAAPAAESRWRCRIQYHAPADARTVALAGDFNNWSRDGSMLRRMAGGVWEHTLELPAGIHRYKFVVNGDRWLADERNPEREPDNHGGFNSLLRLGRLASLSESPARPGDGRIDADGLEHDPQRARYWQTLDRGHALVRYRTLSHDVEQVDFALRGQAPAALSVVDEGPLFTWWEGRVALPAGGQPLEYTFVLTDGSTRRSDPRPYRIDMQHSRQVSTPEWAKHAIWYQIMVERFRNGSPSNDPTPVREWTSDWFTPSELEARSGQSFYRFYVFRRFYGGDIAGMQSRLPYLKQLGVNALYLNPVFIAPTHHKYDATNYLHIDPAYGAGPADDYEKVAASEDLLDPATWKWTASDRMFLDFLREAKAQGFRVIIDGVFNHVGTAHPAFQDVAARGQDSRFADWFDVVSWLPFEYNGWAGFGELPAFRKTPQGLHSASLKKHIFDLTRRWMDPDGDGDPRDGVDGWRLDVPNEIPRPFWADWHAHVKSINPDAYITGEIWDRADEWLDGRHFDAVMNYEFARPAVAWSLYRDQKITVSALDRRLRELRLAYPWNCTLVMQNLVDSHDTDRAVSMALNPDRPYDDRNRPQDNGPDYDNSKPPPLCYQRARLLALLQMTYVGAPMIWYGDEAGMWGADDPTCRKPMLWEDLQPYEKPQENFVMPDHLAFYRRAIELRNQLAPLRSGTFRTLLVDDFSDVWGFVRSTDNEHALVVLNGSPNPRAARVPLRDGLPRRWVVAFAQPTGPLPADLATPAEGAALTADQDGMVALELPPYSGIVLRARD